jgi:hypothetical protein
MAEFSFGTRRHPEPIPQDVVERLDRLCKEHGGSGFAQGRIADGRYQSWFYAPYRDYKKDKALVERVLLAASFLYEAGATTAR